MYSGDLWLPLKTRTQLWSHLQQQIRHSGRYLHQLCHGATRGYSMAAQRRRRVCSHQFGTPLQSQGPSSENNYTTAWFKALWSHEEPVSRLLLFLLQVRKQPRLIQKTPCSSQKPPHALLRPKHVTPQALSPASLERFSRKKENRGQICKPLQLQVKKIDSFPFLPTTCPQQR